MHFYKALRGRAGIFTLSKRVSFVEKILWLIGLRVLRLKNRSVDPGSRSIRCSISVGLNTALQAADHSWRKGADPGYRRVQSA